MEPLNLSNEILLEDILDTNDIEIKEVNAPVWVVSLLFVAKFVWVG